MSEYSSQESSAVPIKHPVLLKLGIATALYAAFSLLFFEPFNRIIMGVNLNWQILWPGLLAGMFTGYAVFAWIKKRADGQLCDSFTGLFLSALLGLVTAFCVSAFIGKGVMKAEIKRLNPDKVFQNSFRQSVRQTPREFQFFLHAGAMKDCKAYGWSYSEMRFYELRSSVAPNVLPIEWIKACNIKRR